METVFKKSINNPEMELIEARNKIKQFEEKILNLTHELEEKKDTIKAIEDNMKRLYVENWTVTDSFGKKGEFSGNVYWVKGSGMLFYKDGTIFEGCWESTGEILHGELCNTYSGDLIKKWDCGEEVEEGEEDN
jgi:hypothetical protein